MAEGFTTVNPTVNPFFFKVEEKSVRIILNRNPVGQDEVDARRKQPTNSLGGLPIPDALSVVVDGFSAKELGFTHQTSSLPVTSPANGITIMPQPVANAADSGVYDDRIQRFTLYYQFNFDASDSFFSFAGDSNDIALNVIAGTNPTTVSASAILTLVKNPDPFILHGDPAWLSVDLRVFPVPGRPASFIRQWIEFDRWCCRSHKFHPGTCCNHHTRSVQGLAIYEEFSKLYVQQNNEFRNPVFNFALAKVHYIGIKPNTFDVQVFFRLFQAQTTTGIYDFSPSLGDTTPAQYREAASTSDGRKIPLAGFLDGEYVTIPFFASKRTNSEVRSM